MVIFLASCSSWKNRLLSHQQQEGYAYQGDTLHGWSLIRLDSMTETWGYVSQDGKRAIQSIFNWADDFTDSMALVHYQDHYTYVNQNGKQMRRIQAPYAYAFSEGLAAVQRGDKWGYINHRGKWVIKPQFDWALPFSQNRAAVAIDNQYGFINTQGEIVIPSQYEDVKSFVNHLSLVRKNGKYGLIDTLGREILPIQYRRIEPWEKGTYKLYVAHKKIGLANPNGHIILDTMYTAITIQRDNFLRAVENGFAGLFDFNGGVILPTAYPFLGFVSDEGFLVAMKDDKYGIVDTTGKTLLPFIYDEVIQPRFSEGRICMQKDGKMLLMDTDFQIIKELPYAHSYIFSNGFAIVEQKDESDPYNKRYGYINRQGEEVIPPQYHSAYRFNKYGLTVVGTRKEGITSQFIIDTTGIQLPIYIAIDQLGNQRPMFYPLYNRQPSSMHDLKPFGDRLFYGKSGSNFTFLSPETGLMMNKLKFPYESLYPLSYSDRKDLATVGIDSLVGLIDTTLTELLPPQFEDISTFTQNRVAVKQEGKWGFADEKFRLRIPFVYDKVSSFRYGYAEVDSSKRKGIIDAKGRIFVPLQYKNTTVDSINNRIYAEREQGSDIYDMYGRLLLHSDYDYISGYWNKNYSTFRRGNKMGVMDYDFHILCRPQYDRIGPLYEDRAWVVNDGKGGFLDSSFQVIIPIEYDYIEDYALGFTRVEKDGEFFYIDINGKRIQPSAEDIINRKDAIEKRLEGFIDFSS
ncbi:WG repeat-containing protein [Sphingobacterium phlebotomi]|uniref:WG repeat-containing protein n=1 Tax=Sphingobacterium phlebotomi TaxID=2605433 RepID=A0A5D4HF29_9SPHI|nr:WG repeat-containing protein [Sphingobacterium phlebotomi]